jgi:hypothetical protein
MEGPEAVTVEIIPVLLRVVLFTEGPEAVTVEVILSLPLLPAGIAMALGFYLMEQLQHRGSPKSSYHRC